MTIALVVDDNKAYLEQTLVALTNAGITAVGAGTVGEARSQARSLGEQLDVVILDMRLDDPTAPDVTGAHVGIDIAASQRRFPPEFMINSGYAEAEYYRLALELGAAAYLMKVSSVRTLVQHTQVLALRRALSINRPGTSKRLQELAERSRDPFEAINRFCRETVSPELTGRISCPHLLLLTSRNTTTACAGQGTTLPLGPHEVYHRIQALTFADTAREPTRIDTAASVFEELGFPNLQTVNGAWSIPLADTIGLRLSLLLFTPLEAPAAAADPETLSQVMARYFKSVVLELVLGIVAAWTLLEGRRKAAIDAIADFCDRVSEEQDEILSEALDNGEFRTDGENRHLSRLTDLGRDLRKAATVLHGLAEKGEEAAPIARPTETEISAAALTRAAWKSFIDDTDFTEPHLLIIESDLQLSAAASNLQGALSDILQWLAGRAVNTPPEITPEIRVHFDPSSAGPQIILDDKSRRLEPQLRRHMFHPFASQDSFLQRGTRLGLFIAKIEIEVGYQGRLEDRSDELPGDIGHRLVLRLPSGTL